ncbi:MAG: 4a-hydroxytetrahydrobiopterin dehydratase [Burkholderiaceae bacterium]
MAPTGGLLSRKCQPQVDALGPGEAKELSMLTDGWQLDHALVPSKVVKRFDFKNYYETLAFVNAVAYVVHAEDHHPELVITYNQCIVKFNTHSVNSGTGGLSINDFICAAKFDAIFRQSFS